MTGWSRRIGAWLGWGERRLYPPHCLLCGAGYRGGRAPLDLCPACLADLPWNRPACGHCGQPLPEGAPPLCGRCLRRPPLFDRLYAPLRYAAPADRLLLAFKFHGRMAPGRVAGELLAEALVQQGTAPPAVIVPVPLHPQRLAQRGYNQALELARPVGRRLGVAVASGLVQRLRATAAQSELTRPARRRNVRGAFAVVGALPRGTIALLDDVVSTGATVTELTRTLKRAGAERVEVWAVARAGRS